MASIRRLSPTIQTFLRSSSKTLTPSTSIHLPRHLTSNSSRDVSRSNYVPAMLAGLLGLGLVDVAYADAPEAKDEAKVPFPPSAHVDMEAIAKKERARLEELLKSKGLTYGSYPRFTVAVKGQKVTIKFQIPPTCEIALLISNIVANLGVKVEERATGSDMALRAWDSGVAWQLTLSPPVVKKEAVQDKGSSDANSNDGDFCVLLFRSLISSDKPEMEFIKQGSFTAEELDALVSVLKLAGSGQSRFADRRGETAPTPSMDKSITSLEGMGVKIYGLKEPKIEDSKYEISWENIAGYTQQKRDIEDTILLALQSPEVYDEIARGTRCKFESNRPRAVLFEGPPGTGKTSCARVIANESERLLGKVFTLANEIPNGAIIFLDEVNSFATSRDSETHEATRRILSVILRQATLLYKLVAERGPWSSLSRWALESYLKGEIGKVFLLYSRMAELGYEVAQSNAAWILDKFGEESMCMGESGPCTDSERHQRAHFLWWQASEQGNEHAALLIGDAYYYGRGTERDYDRAADAYMHAKYQSNAEAMFNLGYMHEHGQGQGLPLDLHLAKRYYDQALEIDSAAKLPVTLALASLRVRRNYANGFLVDIIDSLPSVYPEVLMER